MVKPGDGFLGLSLILQNESIRIVLLAYLAKVCNALRSVRNDGILEVRGIIEVLVSFEETQRYRGLLNAEKQAFGVTINKLIVLWKVSCDGKEAKNQWAL